LLRFVAKKDSEQSDQSVRPGRRVWRSRWS